uniref:Uncharacterized protein n=1 Tax=Amphimedon queenslandica TaxID=400682 RepID=A0A1X7VA08_AMPQE
MLKTFLIHQKVIGKHLIVNIYCGNTKNWVKVIGVCPCVVNCIRKLYPSSTGRYMGFRSE